MQITQHCCKRQVFEGLCSQQGQQIALLQGQAAPGRHIPLVPFAGDPVDCRLGGGSCAVSPGQEACIVAMYHSPNLWPKVSD